MVCVVLHVLDGISAVYIQYVYTYDGISVAAGGGRINSRLCVFSGVSAGLKCIVLHTYVMSLF